MTMTRLRYILLATLLLALCSCTQNNGRIGRLFGSWVLETVTLNGQPLPMPNGTETIWSFQSDVLRITLEEEYHHTTSYFSTFSQIDGNILRLDFTHKDDNTPAGTGVYGAPVWMGFPESGVFDLTVADSPKDRLVLTFTRSSSQIYTYTFSKTW